MRALLRTTRLVDHRCVIFYVDVHWLLEIDFQKHRWRDDEAASKVIIFSYGTGKSYYVCWTVLPKTSQPV